MSHRNPLGLPLLLLLTIALPALARTQTGFLDRTIAVSGATYRYQVFVPADFSKHKSWPVILFLHGAGERGSDGLLQTDVGIAHAIRLHSARFPFVVVIPQCGEGKIWGEPDMQAQSLAALQAAIKEFHGDRSRVYLTGLSMGGFGTWELAARNPGRFAALVPICSGIRPQKDWPQLRVTLIDDLKITDSYAEIARRIGSTPVWIFHGDADPAVPVTESRHMADALKAANAKFKYTEYPGVGHNSWDQAYAEPDLVPWLLAQSLSH
jgi:predicted peptidase